MGGTIRAMLEDAEARTLHPRAALSAASRGRDSGRGEDELRPAYQRDRDRILHCKSFRRLQGKTQVFLAPRGDHYRNRLTHTLEVAQVARSIARALRLNEMLVEAVCMGHDLGHTPFGHAGERLLDEVVEGGFHHALQSVRVVEVLERDGAGLDLTPEVRDGILRHSKGRGNVLMSGGGAKALTLEAEVVRVADVIAYVNHDLDDAVRGGLLAEADVPVAIRRVLGGSAGERVARLVGDVVRASRLDVGEHIAMSPEVHEALLALREILYGRVYENPLVKEEFTKAQRALRDLWTWLAAPGATALRSGLGVTQAAGDPTSRAVTDFVSGMTDRFALECWQGLAVPRPWGV